MKLKKNLLRLAFVIATTAASTSAFAHWSVYDPVNWLQNFMSARSELSTEISQAKSLVEQVNAAKDLARSTKSLTNLSGLAGVDKARQLYSSLIALDSQLDSNLEESSRFTQDLRAQYGASNMSWEQFAASRSRLETAAQRASRERYTAIAHSMEETSQRRREIVSQLGQVQGQTQAMQALGAALDVIIGQNQQMLAAMVAKEKQDEANKTPNQSQQQWAENQRALYQKSLRESASKY